jgi:adenylate cyclase
VSVGQEIERKFLVDAVPDDVDLGAGLPILQGYLTADDAGVEVRVRRLGDRTFLTIKKGGGRMRVEEELEIDLARFERLWALTEGARLEKRRHRVPLSGNLIAEVDVYQGGLAPLRTVDVEFRDGDAAEAFDPPAWFGRELTEDARYRNRRLARLGLPSS